MVSLIFVCKSSGQEKRIEDQTVAEKEEKFVTQKKIEHERKKKRGKRKNGMTEPHRSFKTLLRP
jgi:hypothetical protein